MKRVIHNLIGILAVCGILFTSCEDMENEPLELQSDIYVWDEDDYTGAYAVQWLNYIYTFVPAGMDRFSGQPMESLTDDAIPTDVANANWGIINSGYSTTNMFPLSFTKDKDTYGESWGLLYKAIRYCNIFLHNYQKVPWSDLEEAAYYANEARALRAYFYWLLVRAYGGIPLIGDEVFSTESPELRTLKRNSFEECIQYIKSEMEAVKDNLRPYTDLSERRSPNEDINSVANGTDNYWGCVRKWGLMGIEARMLLYAASPLVNGTGNVGEPWLGYPENDPARWKEAADICRTIITSGQFLLEKDRTRLSRTTVNGEVLWMKSGQDGNGTYANSWAYKNSPMGYTDRGSWGNDGRKCVGQTSPTQELVDAFPMKNGKSIEEAKASGEYDPQDPYKNRDPRLSHTVFYHNSRWLKENVDVSEGGKDNNSIDPKQEGSRTKTGYYLKRHLAQDEENTTFSKTNYHSSLTAPWMIIRYADILLMYAEAQAEYLNKAMGMNIITDETVYEAVEQVRERAGLNPFKLKRGMAFDELIQVIRNERRCEFAFEESRFWDIRRWKIAENVYSKSLHGVRITKNDDGSSHYDYDVVVATPYWHDRMYRLPIDHNEVLFNPNIMQNPGY